VAWTVDSHLGYVTDDDVRAKAKDVLSAIGAFGQSIAIDSVKSGISIKLNGRVFAYGWPKRRYFTFGYPGTDEQWTSESIEPGTDVGPLKAAIRAAYERKRVGG